MRQISRRMAVSVMALAGAFAVLNGDPAGRAAWAAQSVSNIDARLIAINIPGASAVAQVGTFLNDPAACARPIPNLFPTYIQPGAVLDPIRILVGSRSNFGAPLAPASGRKGRFFPSTRPALVPLASPRTSQQRHTSVGSWWPRADV